MRPSLVPAPVLLAALLMILPMEPLAGQAADTLQLRVVPERVQVELDETRQLALEVPDAHQGRLEGRTVNWFTQDPGVASVNDQGVVRAMGSGETRVAALVDGVVAFATVIVPIPPPTEVEVYFTSDPVPTGTSAPIHLRALNRLGHEVEPDEVEFHSQDPGVAGVDPTGRVLARRAGQTTIQIVADGVESRVEVAVRDVPGLAVELVPARTSVRTGDVVRFRLQGQAGDGSQVQVHPLWTVDRGGAHVENEGGEGVFVAESPGRYRVTAVLGEGHVETALVQVEPREYDAELVQVGRGVLDGHHAGDSWVFEGLDGRDYVLIGTFMYDWLKVWDVTDPSQPILTDSIRMDARRINDVKVHPGNHLAVATREGASDRRNGIVVLDLSEPAHPTIVSEYTETVTGGVHNVWLEGDLVYACHNGTSDLHIIDISDPQNPREVGRWGLDRESKTLHDAMVHDGYAYLSYWHDGLVVLDVGAGTHGGTPTEPVFVSRFSYPAGHTHTAWPYENYVFVGDEIFPSDWDPNRPIEARGYVHVLDMTDMENPREVARYEVPEAGAHNFWVENDVLYVGYYQAGLRVVDVSGELRGDLYRQGREMASLRTTDQHTMVPNWPMTWGAQPFKGNLYSSDLNSGLWITRFDLRSGMVF